MSEAACECLQRSFRPLVRSDAGTSSSGTGLSPFAMQTFPRRPGIETRPTTESARNIPNRRPRTGTTRQIPVAYVGNPRRPQDVLVLRPASPHTTSCAYEREVDSPLRHISKYRLSGTFRQGRFLGWCVRGIGQSSALQPATSTANGISYIGRKVENPRLVINAGMLYTLGRCLLYLALAGLLTTTAMSIPAVALFL